MHPPPRPAPRTRLRASLLAAVLGIAHAAAAAAALDIRIEGPVVDRQLPSGSGMGWHDGQYYVVGDDAPYLFVLDRRFAIRDRILLKAYPVGPDGRIPKALKPDYEAMATLSWSGRPWSLILGSGSAAERYTGYLVAIDGSPDRHARDLRALYQDFAALDGFPPGQGINIEALAIAGDTAYFFNRGNAGRNLLLRVPLPALIDYMTGASPRVAGIRLNEVRLPRLKGLEAGLSGADYWPEVDSLVYSASVENTDNARDDGAVLGSYLGLIPLRTLQDGVALDLRHSAQLLTRGGRPVVTKVESVVLTQTGRERATGALLSDNDDGSSAFFDLTLTLTQR